MKLEEWSAVKEAFEASLPLPVCDREVYLSSACASEAIRAAVESLLAVYESDTEFLEESALKVLGSGFQDAALGEQLGSYQLRRAARDHY